MNPHRLAWGYAYSFPFAAVVAITTIGAWLISKEPKRIPLCWTSALLFVFTLWISFTTIFSLVPDSAYEKWSEVMKIMIMAAVALILSTSRKRLDALIWVVVVSIGFYALRGGTFALITGGQWMTFGPEGSFIGSNNALALALIMVLPLMRYLHMQSRIWWVRWGLVVTMGCALLTIFASYSRGAIVALASVLFVLMIKSQQRGVVLLLVGGAVVVGTIFMPEKWVDRIQTIRQYETDPSAQGRFDAWEFGFQIANSRPLLGGGFGVSDDEDLFAEYSPGAASARSFHSNYFEALGEHGYVGLALYLALGISALMTASSVIRRSKLHPELKWSSDLAAMLQVSLVGYAVGGLFLNKAYFDLYYHLLAMLIAAHVLVDKELKGPARRQDVPLAAEGPPAFDSRSDVPSA